MGKRVVKIWDLPSSGTSFVLLVLSVFFLLGGFMGCIFTNQVEGSSSEAIKTYLEGFLTVSCSGKVIRPEFISVLWEIVRWPLLVFSLGLTPLGLLGIPVVFLIRGFLMSFAIASFFRVLGATGLVVAFIVFGITGLLCIPALFGLGIQSFLTAGAMTDRLVGENKRRQILNRLALLRCALCCGAFFICVLLEYSVIPNILGSLADVLLT